MSNTYLNPNNYSDGRNGMYTQPPVTSFYTSLSGSTSNPGAPQMVMNPNDLPYKTAISAFNNGLLNPNQNSPQSLSRNYYTINSAYGSTPSVTQISRACTGNVVSSVPDIPQSVNIPNNGGVFDINIPNNNNGWGDIPQSVIIPNNNNGWGEINIPTVSPGLMPIRTVPMRSQNIPRPTNNMPTPMRSQNIPRPTNNMPTPTRGFLSSLF